MISAVLGFLPDYVTIVQDGRAAGASGHTGGDKMVRAPGVLDQMVVSYAGFAAHVRYAPDAKERALLGARDDFKRAERCMSVLPIGGLGILRARRVNSVCEVTERTVGRTAE